MATFDTNALQPVQLRSSNPFEMASNAVSLRNALLQNKINQAAFNAKKR